MAQYLAKYLAKLAGRAPEAAEAGNKAMRLAILDRFQNLTSPAENLSSLGGRMASAMRDEAELARGVRPGATTGRLKHGLGSFLGDAGLSNRQIEPLLARIHERVGPDLDKFEAWSKLGQPSRSDVMPIMEREGKRLRDIESSFQDMLEKRGSGGPSGADIEQYNGPFQRSQKYLQNVVDTYENQDRAGLMRTGLRPDGASLDKIERYIAKRKGKLG